MRLHRKPGAVKAFLLLPHWRLQVGTGSADPPFDARGHEKVPLPVLAPPNAAVIWNAAFTERQAARGELPLPQCQWPARQAGRAGRSPISGSPPGTESQSTQAGSGVDEQYRRVDDDRDARSRSPGGGTRTNQTAGAQGDSDPTSRLRQWLVQAWAAWLSRCFVHSELSG